MRVLLMPLLMEMGFAPAVTDWRPRRIISRESTEAVVGAIARRVVGAARNLLDELRAGVLHRIGKLDGARDGDTIVDHLVRRGRWWGKRGVSGGADDGEIAASSELRVLP